MSAALTTMDAWAGPRAGAAVLGPGGAVRAVHGGTDEPLPWASVTKLVTASLVLLAVEAGSLELDEPAGPPGATVRHLLAHASGLGFEGETPISAPARTRIYSNAGYDALGRILEARTGRPLAEHMRTAFLEPLGMVGTALVGRAGEGLSGPLEDLVRLAAELVRPAVLPPGRLREATRVAYPGLAGVLPGFGRYDPLDWGLGFELRDAKAGHWTGTLAAPSTFGHFGGSGAAVWVDPVAGIALALLSDRAFGPWAVSAWPAFSDAVERVGRAAVPSAGGDPPAGAVRHPDDR